MPVIEQRCPKDGKRFPIYLHDLEQGEVFCPFCGSWIKIKSERRVKK
jgi:uncharacterized Zn finger protein (UPF0148 family)